MESYCSIHLQWETQFLTVLVVPNINKFNRLNQMSEMKKVSPILNCLF